MMIPRFRFTICFMLISFIASFIGCTHRKRQPDIRLHYLGHASFILNFEERTKVLTDFGTSRAWGLDSPIYPVGLFRPDVLTTSHLHHIDHYGRELPVDIPHQLTGNDSLRLGRLFIFPIRTNEQTSDTPDNSSFVFQYRGVTIVHLGDAQADIIAVETLEQSSYRNRFPERIDLLLMTIEGPTGFIEEAEAFVRLLKPRRIIPMHYWSIQYKEDFLAYLENVSGQHGVQYTIHRSEQPDYKWNDLHLPDSSIEVISLEPAPYSINSDYP